VRELVALDLPGGQSFVDALLDAWEAGDAVAPLDPRLPRPAAAAQLAILRPNRIVGANGETTRLPDGLGVDDGDALVVATSGSTGTPRAAVLTHAAVAASARATSLRLGVDPSRHRWLGCLPLAHIGGLAVVTRAVVTGTRLTVLPRFDAELVADMGRRGDASHVALVTSALRRTDTAAYERVLLGGSTPPSLRADNVVTTYGLTETGSGVVYDGVPLDEVEVAIGTGKPGEGLDGEILLRGPTLLRVYRDGTDPRIVGPDRAGGWFPTGDGGRLDAGGRLVVSGRLAEVIVTGAEKVWPASVEMALAELPSVAEAAVWKRPDAEWGERVVAWVVPVDPSDPPALETLRDAVSATIAPWAAPKELVLVRELPRTASGKVRRLDLR
jgi:O-succinylbenzoic acid--CoA ligase